MQKLRNGCMLGNHDIIINLVLGNSVIHVQFPRGQ